MHTSEIYSISRIVQKNELLMDPADPRADDQYDISNYLPLGSVQFVALLDRQVVSYLVRILSSSDITQGSDVDILRATAALQAFLCITNTVSEPGPSYNEYADTQGIEKADKEFALFRSADNVDYEIWKALALGKIKSIPRDAIPEFKSGELAKAIRNDRVRDFEYNLTIVKKAIIIKRLGLSGFNSITMLMDWMHNDYICTTPSLFFLMLYFSNHPVPRMIKGGSNKAARNAAWDLCVLQQWRANMCSVESSRVFLSSFDKALKSVAVMLFPARHEETVDYFKRIESTIVEMYGKNTGDGKRVFDRFKRLQQEVSDPSRAHNQQGNFQNHEFILRVREIVDKEFATLSAE